jgi:hypothetical protein
LKFSRNNFKTTEKRRNFYSKPRLELTGVTIFTKGIFTKKSFRKLEGINFIPNKEFIEIAIFTKGIFMKQFLEVGRR